MKKDKYVRVLIAVLAMCASFSPRVRAQYQYPFQNPKLPVEQRVDDILSRMTLDEKIACLGTNPSVPRLGIVGTGHVEGLHGLALGGVIVVAGFVTTLVIVIEWIDHGFGALGLNKLAVVAFELLIVGIQVFFSSFLLSILGLRREDPE